jgi:hypothetical protein
MQNFEFWLAVDNEGNSAVSMDGAKEARETLTDDFESAAVRVVKITAAVELPEIQEVHLQVPGSADDEPIDAIIEETAAEEPAEHEHELEPA